MFVHVFLTLDIRRRDTVRNAMDAMVISPRAAATALNCGCFYTKCAQKKNVEAFLWQCIAVVLVMVSSLVTVKILRYSKDFGKVSPPIRRVETVPQLVRDIFQDVGRTVRDTVLPLLLWETNMTSVLHNRRGWLMNLFAVKNERVAF